MQLVNIKQNCKEMLSKKRKRNRLRAPAQMRTRKLKMMQSSKRRKRSQNDKLSKNHHLLHLKVNLVQKKKRKRSGKRNQRKLNLLLNLILNNLKKRKRKKSQLRLSKRQVDCKNHPEQLANSAHRLKVILTILETSERSYRAARELQARNKILKHSPKQIAQRPNNNLNHLNSNKLLMT